jgi:hypothetical protein
MYSYTQVNGGADNGSTTDGNLALLTRQGAVPMQGYAAGNYNYLSQPTRAERAIAPRYRFTGYSVDYTMTTGYASALGFVPATGTDAERIIKYDLAHGKPVELALPVFDEFMNATATSYLVQPPAATSSLYGYHAIVGVGYDQNGVWIENQWGTGWGKAGYAELSWAFVNGYIMEVNSVTGASFHPLPYAPQPRVHASASITLSVKVLYGSTIFVMTGHNFRAFEAVWLTWNGTNMGYRYAGPDGTWSVESQMIATPKPGTRLVHAVGSQGDQASYIAHVKK